MKKTIFTWLLPLAFLFGAAHVSAASVTANCRLTFAVYLTMDCDLDSHWTDWFIYLSLTQDSCNMQLPATAGSGFFYSYPPQVAYTFLNIPSIGIHLNRHREFTCIGNGTVHVWTGGHGFLGIWPYENHSLGVDHDYCTASGAGGGGNDPDPPFGGGIDP